MRTNLLIIVLLLVGVSAEGKSKQPQPKIQVNRLAAELAVAIARAELVRVRDVFQIVDPDLDALDVMVSSPAENRQFLERYMERKKAYLKTVETLNKLDKPAK